MIPYVVLDHSLSGGIKYSTEPRTVGDIPASGEISVVKTIVDPFSELIEKISQNNIICAAREKEPVFCRNSIRNNALQLAAIEIDIGFKLIKEWRIFLSSYSKRIGLSEIQMCSIADMLCLEEVLARPVHVMQEDLQTIFSKLMEEDGAPERIKDLADSVLSNAIVLRLTKNHPELFGDPGVVGKINYGNHPSAFRLPYFTVRDFIKLLGPVLHARGTLLIIDSSDFGNKGRAEVDNFIREALHRRQGCLKKCKIKYRCLDWCCYLKQDNSFFRNAWENRCDISGVRGGDWHDRYFVFFRSFSDASKGVKIILSSPVKQFLSNTNKSISEKMRQGTAVAIRLDADPVHASGKENMGMLFKALAQDAQEVVRTLEV